MMKIFVTTAGIGADNAGIGRKACTPHQPLGHAAQNRRLEELAVKITLTKTTMARLREGGVVRNSVLQSEP